MSKAALVTGGAKRVGKSIIKKLALLGYDVAIHYNNSEKEARDLKKELTVQGVRSEIFKCNLEMESQVSELIREVMYVFTNLELLVNNASIFERAGLINTDNELFNKTFKINFKAPYILSRDFAFRSGKGHIINILDTKIVKNQYVYSAYTLSKKCLAELTKMSANELGPDIRVNGICPGLILAPEGKDSVYLEKMAEKIPAKKIGKLENVTNAIEFLIKNEYLTGQFLFIDGGQHLV